ncbi:hypothetical protein V6B14_12200 [Sporosarcina psychrophila]|uniref:hypothetical protein n=1 Tax=Sporosarcina psychrophila TaxID=1476 RepID=UPI0030D5CD49
MENDNVSAQSVVKVIVEVISMGRMEDWKGTKEDLFLFLLPLQIDQFRKLPSSIYSEFHK